MENKGYTVTFVPWEDMMGRERVIGRFKTEEEKDEFLKEIHSNDSGWLPEELATVCVINDYNYTLSR